MEGLGIVELFRSDGRYIWLSYVELVDYLVVALGFAVPGR